MRTIPMSGRILALAVLILSLGLPVEAQLAKILRETNLTQDDMKLANGAAQSLFEKSGVARGQQASWQNPESGATGVVEVLDLEQGGKCITVRHVTQPQDKPQRQFKMRRCKDGDIWTLAP